MPPSLKRAASSDDSELETDSIPKTSSRKRNRVSDADHNSQQEAEEVDGLNNDNEEECDDFEDSDNEEDQAKAAEIQQALDARSTEVSESGTIDKIEVFNFMCHKNLKMKFGPKINFVIGHNGSGKSAVLTALVVALGAKASATNRGKNLSSLIREGSNFATITIRITNKGGDAYKPDVYGDYITVERRLMRDGANTFKIKSATEKVISTKRDELVAICDHMSIQVDNPITMLSQDQARQFLNSSSARDKYNLFMRGSQLAQLAKDFETIRETLEITTASIERRKTFLPDLHRKAKEAEMKYKELTDASELEGKIDELNNELVWSQIIRKERELERAKAATSKLEEQVNETEQRIVVTNGKITRFEEEIKELNEQMKDYQTDNPLNTSKRNELNDRKMDWTRRRNELKSDMLDANSQIKRYKEQIRKCEEEIAVATAKLESSNREKLETINSEIQQLQKSKELLLEKSRRLAMQKDENDETLRAKKGDLINLKTSLDQLQQKYKNTQRNLQNLQAQKENKLKAFGQRMPEALVQIASERRWSGHPPVGPFGQYMNLKYPEYAEVLEITLGNQLTSFAVDNFEDQKLLKSILVRNDLGRCNIIVAKKDIFDFSSDEPDASLLTMLRALHFDDEYVKRQLIIANSIHQVILMEERPAAEQLMSTHPAKVKACYTKDCQNVGARVGMRTESLRRHKGPIRFKKDVESDIRETQKELREIGEEGKSVKEEIIKLEKELRLLSLASEKTKSELGNVSIEIRRTDREILHNQDSLKENEPVNLASLEEDKEELLKSVKQCVSMFRELKNEENQLVTEGKAIQEEFDALDDQEDEHSRRVSGFQDAIRKMEELLHKQRASMVQLKETRNTRKHRYETAKQEEIHVQDVLKEWTNQAIEDYPNRVETENSADVIQRNIDLLERQLEERERSAGMTLQEAEELAVKAFAEYNNAKDSISSLEVLIKRMNEALIKRMDRWSAFRMYISLSAKGYFKYYMHKRGDDGTLKFNHRKQLLEVRVSTGDQFKDGNERKKDSKSLSGGEKSFSQISFLLSLWHGVSSPILCLDEFDVYMDAVNRKQSMKMMMDAAYDTHSQYILITPQDASNMVPGPLVTVHRMADPERKQ